MVGREDEITVHRSPIPVALNITTRKGGGHPQTLRGKINTLPHYWEDCDPA